MGASVSRCVCCSISGSTRSWADSIVLLCGGFVRCCLTVERLCARSVVVAASLQLTTASRSQTLRLNCIVAHALIHVGHRQSLFGRVRLRLLLALLGVGLGPLVGDGHSSGGGGHRG